MGKKGKEPVPPKEPAEPEGGKQWSDEVNALLDAVEKKYPSVERRDGLLADEPALLVDPSEAFDVAVFLNDNDHLSLNYCRSVTGTDKVDRFEVAYNLAHLPLDRTDGFERVAMIVRIYDRETPSTPSMVSLWKSVDFQEREVFDLVGVNFEDHPDLRRILLDERFVGHPLRKDYPLEGRWEDMQAINAYMDEKQVKKLKEAAGENFNPETDVPPSFKR